MHQKASNPNLQTNNISTHHQQQQIYSIEKKSDILDLPIFWVKAVGRNVLNSYFAGLKIKVEINRDVRASYIQNQISMFISLKK